MVFDGDHDFEGPRSPKAHFDTVNASGNLQLDGEVVCQSVSLAGDPPRLRTTKSEKPSLGSQPPRIPIAMHHAGANVLSPTVRDLSITHRNLPLSRAHPISCPQSRSQRPVYAPPHRERSLDQIVIYLTTEALAALPLRAQPPRPRPRCPQSRSQCVLSYRERSLDQVAICCISPEAVTIRSSTTLKLTPSPQPRCPQNRSQCALSYTPRETLYQIAIYFIIRSPRSSSTVLLI